MAYRSDELKAGAFVLMAILLFLGFVATVIGIQFLEKKSEYRARFKYIGTLDEESEVRFGGKKVGKVKQMTFPKEAGGSIIEVLFEVEDGTPIKTDSEATVKLLGLLGNYNVDITLGSAEAEILTPGSLIKSKETPTIDDLLSQMQGGLSTAESLIVHLDALVDEENRGHIKDALANIDDMLAENKEALGQTIANINSASVNLDNLVANLNEIMGAGKEDLTASIKGLRATVEESQKLISGIRSTMVANRTNLDQSLYSIRRTSQNLEELTDKLKEKPWMLIRKSNEKPRKMPR